MHNLILPTINTKIPNFLILANSWMITILLAGHDIALTFSLHSLIVSVTDDLFKNLLPTSIFALEKYPFK